MESVTGLLNNLAVEGQKLLGSAPDVRLKIIAQARALQESLETPLETMLRIGWEEPTRFFATRLALDLKIFETLADGKTKTLAELSAPTGADSKLVQRIVRHLAATGIVHEAGKNTYEANATSKAFAKPEYAAGVRFLFDCAMPSYSKIPLYFEERGWHNPDNGLDGPFQFGQGPGHGFEWLNKHPKVFEAFFLYVYAQRTGRPSWMDPGFYPVQERLIEGLNLENSDASALVDVGGGAGQSLEEFRVKVPEFKGRLVLQEQEMVAAQAKVDARIEVQTHDFFTPQPVKGARCYYLRNVLHDWPDERCRVILGHLKDAMTPGYSKILLNECVLADEKPHWQQTSMDLHMMALAAAQERNNTDWHALIESVGLKINGIWEKGEGNEGIIEVVN